MGDNDVETLRTCVKILEEKVANLEERFELRTLECEGLKGKLRELEVENDTIKNEIRDIKDNQEYWGGDLEPGESNSYCIKCVVCEKVETSYYKCLRCHACHKSVCTKDKCSIIVIEGIRCRNCVVGCERCD